MAHAVDPTYNMNAVIHRSLARDLDRLEQVTRTDVGDARRTAVTGFVAWLLDTLHHHHVGEDEGLWPRLLAKRPDLAPIVAEMESEHRVLAAASDALRAAAAAWSTDGSSAARERVHAATVAMQEATLPHLEHEEREMVPLAVEALDADDWAYLSKNHFRKGLSMADAGSQLVWFLDDAEPRYVATVREEVPGPVVAVMSLVHGRRYDRAAKERWGDLAGTRR